MASTSKNSKPSGPALWPPSPTGRGNPAKLKKTNAKVSPVDTASTASSAASESDTGNVSATTEASSTYDFSAQSALSTLSCATRLDPNLQGAPAAAAAPVVSEDMSVVRDLIATMKTMISSLDTTFDSLAVQTDKIATLAPAIVATDRIKDLCAELRLQYARQEAELTELKNKLSSTILDELAQRYEQGVRFAIEQAVANEVRTRVKAQLKDKIPPQLQQQVKRHARQILTVQTKLHNCDARRHNATVRSTSLTEQLRPLLRPLPTPAQSPAQRKATPATPHFSPYDTDNVFPEPPTPSPLFPRDLQSLLQMKEEDARTLVAEYGIAVAGRTGDDAKTPTTSRSAGNGNKGKNDGKEPPPSASSAKEEIINDFMGFIGVPLMMVTPPKSNKSPMSPGGKLRSPLVSRSGSAILWE